MTWIAAASIAHGRLSVDLIALLALAGAIAVDELLAAAVISVMLTGGRARRPGPPTAPGTT